MPWTNFVDFTSKHGIQDDVFHRCVNLTNQFSFLIFPQISLLSQEGRGGRGRGKVQWEKDMEEEQGRAKKRTVIQGTRSSKGEGKVGREGEPLIPDDVDIRITACLVFLKDDMNISSWLCLVWRRMTRYVVGGRCLIIQIAWGARPTSCDILWWYD